MKFPIITSLLIIIFVLIILLVWMSKKQNYNGLITPSPIPITQDSNYVILDPDYYYNSPYLYDPYVYYYYNGWNYPWWWYGSGGGGTSYYSNGGHRHPGIGHLGGGGHSGGGGHHSGRGGRH